MWWRDESLIGLLEGWWKEHRVGGSISFKMAKKLQYLKQNLKEWNEEKLLNIFSKKVRVEEDLESLNEKVIRDGMRNEEFLKEKELKEKWFELLKRGEIYWRDKSREVWLSNGDSNYKFFHASVLA